MYLVSRLSFLASLLGWAYSQTVEYWSQPQIWDDGSDTSAGSMWTRFDAPSATSTVNFPQCFADSAGAIKVVKPVKINRLRIPLKAGKLIIADQAAVTFSDFDATATRTYIVPDCFKFENCQAGELYIGMNNSCAPCPEGTFQEERAFLDACTEQSEPCSERQVTVSAATSVADFRCRAKDKCEGSQYVVEDGNTTLGLGPVCSDIVDCARGEFEESAPVAGKSNRVCKACPELTFNPDGILNAPQCTEKDKCGINEFVSDFGDAATDLTCKPCAGSLVQPIDQAREPRCQVFRPPTPSPTPVAGSVDLAPAPVPVPAPDSLQNGDKGDIVTSPADRTGSVGTDMPTWASGDPSANQRDEEGTKKSDNATMIIIIAIVICVAGVIVAIAVVVKVKRSKSAADVTKTTTSFENPMYDSTPSGQYNNNQTAHYLEPSTAGSGGTDSGGYMDIPSTVESGGTDSGGYMDVGPNASGGASDGYMDVSPHAADDVQESV